jgi:pSer/pThr/pTyr-binding forkhead associated (FHA) protein
VAQALKHGDLISLAGAEAFRLSVETGEIEGPQEQPVTPTPKPGTLDRPRFKSDWKTRLEWDSLELRALAAIRGGAAPAPGSAAAADATLLPGRKADKAPPTKPAPARPELSQPVPPAASPARPTAPVKAAAPTADDEPPTIMASGKTAPRPAAPRPAAPPARPAAPPAPIRQVRLSAPGIEFTVAEPGPHELGRAQDATLRVTSATVSRRHARIVLGEDRAAAFVQDLGGANGTHCNGERVEGLRPLADGDVISIGELALRVRIVRD